MASDIWVVRAGRGAAQIEWFLDNSYVAIGWRDIGEVPEGEAVDEIYDRLRYSYPDVKPRASRGHANLIHRFLNSIEVGDEVVTYDPGTRVYHYGVVAGPAEWRGDDPLPRVRSVTWKARIQRDTLSVSTRNSLGSISTMFRLGPEPSEEIRKKAVPTDQEVPAIPATDEADRDSDEEPDSIREDVISRSEEFIEDRIAQLDWNELQHLVAGILRAMGYRTQVSDPGPDRGVDVFASPDGLGLEEPRIFVEVKHRPNTSIGAPEIRAFLGGRKSGDKGLYVSTGGFTREARYEADRASFPLRLLALPELRELLVTHYENLDAAATALVPLTRLYWPVD